VLGQLIDTYVAYQGAKTLKLDLVGTRQMVAQAALDYVSRDAKATQDAMKKYYDSNTSNFTIPAQAEATRVDFTTKADAASFRSALLQGKALDATAKADHGTVKDLGTVKPGDLVTELDTALFKTNAFTALPNSKQGITDVLVLSQPVNDNGASGGSSGSSSSGSNSASGNSGGEAGSSSASQPKTKDTYVVLLAVRTPQRTRSFSEVKDQVQAAVLSNQQQQLRTDWLDKMKKQIKVENNLAQIQKQQQQQPSSGANGSAPSTGAGSSSTGSSSTGSSSAGSSSGGTPSNGASGSGSGQTGGGN